MKTTIIALSATALIAAAPAVLAQVPSKTPGLQQKVSKKHHSGVSGYAPLREIKPRARRTSIRELSVTLLVRF